VCAQGRHDFMARVEASVRQAAQYEDPALHAQARAAAPVAELAAAAAADEAALGPRDALLKALLHWFKHSFFRWVNQAPCSTCGVRAGRASARGSC
jgi:peptide-N4-(N-acetyl-beta-glucosaminyl)asparagine amidase